MKNYVQPGKTITLAAPYAVAAGDGLLVGAIFGVATAAAGNGEAVEAVLVGVFDLKKTASQAWAGCRRGVGRNWVWRSLRGV